MSNLQYRFPTTLRKDLDSATQANTRAFNSYDVNHEHIAIHKIDNKNMKLRKSSQ